MIHPVPCCCDPAPIMVRKQKPTQVVYSTLSATSLNGSGQFTRRYQYDDLTNALSGFAAKLCVGSDNEDSLYIISGQSVIKIDSTNTTVWTYNAASASWSHKWLAVNANQEVWASHVNGTTLRFARINASGAEVWNQEYTSTALSGEHNFLAVDLSENSVVCGTNRVLVSDVEAELKYHDPDGNLVWTILASSLVDYFPAHNPGILNSLFGRPIFDADGNVYVGFYFLTETNNGLTEQSVQYDTLFKFDPSGATVWVKQLGTQIEDIAFDSAGRLYVCYDNSLASDPVDVRLTRFSGSDHSTVDWDIQLPNILGINDDVVIAVSDFVYTFHARTNNLTSERIKKSDGSVLQAVDMTSTFTNRGLVANPGMYPHFQ